MDNDDTVLNARLQATMVDAEVGLAGTFTAVDPRRIRLLQSAVKWAKRAKDCRHTSERRKVLLNICANM